jgi:hypothetical protein
MPGFDKTGPEGVGAMTGRRMGRCTGYGKKLRPSTQSENLEDFPESYGRRGFDFGWRERGRGRGRGMGFRNRFRGGE